MEQMTSLPGPLIETRDLHYRFASGQVAVDHLSLLVPKGSIYGFLGPNGAGKTTTLRLLLGLLRKQQGEVHFFGQPLSENRLPILSRIGTMIETPSVYGHLDARDNLRLWARMYACPDKRIGEVLDIVGLADTGRKKAGAFSLGMKQRLGIAVALLPQPEILILDEPTNGLDPNGIIEIRDLLRRLNTEQGITMLISSHILSEMEKLVSHLGVIRDGRMMFQGTFEELGRMQKPGIRLETGDNPRAQDLLLSGKLPGILPDILPGPGMLSREETESASALLLPALDKPQVAAVVASLVAAGIPVYRVEQKDPSLETIFMDLIK